jgi:hypothetical protein
MKNTLNIVRDIPTFTQTLRALWKEHEYSTCYTSLGSKQNEEYTYFSYPEKNRDKCISSNAINQMFPGYLRSYFPEKCGLIIVIDHFPSEKTEQQHAQLLHTVSQSTNRNMDILIFNTLITITSIQEITTLILSTIDTLDQYSYLFANFLCFRNTPDEREMHLEEQVPKKIQEVLDKEYEGKYKNCLYQWYGYTYYQYHYMYCYNTYNLFRMMRATQLLNLLKHNFKNTQLSPMNICYVNAQMELEPDRNSRHIWREFHIHSKSIL